MTNASEPCYAQHVDELPHTSKKGLADLPPELLIMIINQLDPQKIWELRCLSKTFDKLLREPSIIEHALQRYETHSAGDVAKVGTLQARIGRLMFHQAGMPAGIMQYEVPSGDYVFPPRLRLSGRYLACLGLDRRRQTLLIVDLLSQETEEVNHIYGFRWFEMSHSMLMWTDELWQLCMCKLDNLNELRILQLSNKSKTFAVFGDAVAYINRHVLHISEFGGHSISVVLKRSKHALSLILTAELCLLFRHIRREVNYFTHVTCYSRTGAVVGSFEFISGSAQDKQWAPTVQPTGRPDEFHVIFQTSMAQRLYKAYQQQGVLNVLPFKWTPLPTVHYKPVYWKGGLYHAEVESTMSELVCGRTLCRRRERTMPTVPQIMINESFLVHFDQMGSRQLTVFTFDPTSREGMISSEDDGGWYLRTDEDKLFGE